jgi:hypothetical protein
MPAGNDSRLIIVEGLTGSGKSTLAHFISRQLQYNGIPSDWLHEAEESHPLQVDVGGCIEEYMAQMSKQWAAFTANVQLSGRVVTVEACFFNNLLETLLAGNLERQRILSYAVEIQSLMAPLHPALVFLHPGDTAQALERNFSNRGQSFKNFVIRLTMEMPYAVAKGLKGYEGMLVFWREFTALTDEVFAAWPFAKLMVETGKGGWAKNNCRVLDFLSITPFEELRVSGEEADWYAGLYRQPDCGREFRVEYQDGALRINLVGNAFTPLVRMSDGAFLAEGWHFEVRFAPDGQSLHIGGRDVDYLRLVGTKAYR